HSASSYAPDRDAIPFARTFQTVQSDQEIITALSTHFALSKERNLGILRGHGRLYAMDRCQLTARTSGSMLTRATIFSLTRSLPLLTALRKRPASALRPVSFTSDAPVGSISCLISLPLLLEFRLANRRVLFRSAARCLPSSSGRSSAGSRSGWESSQVISANRTSVAAGNGSRAPPGACPGFGGVLPASMRESTVRSVPTAHRSDRWRRAAGPSPSPAS